MAKKKKTEFRMTTIRFIFFVTNDEDFEDEPFYIDFEQYYDGALRHNVYKVTAETFNGDIDPFDEYVNECTPEMAEYYFKRFIDRQSYFE